MEAESTSGGDSIDPSTWVPPKVDLGPLYRPKSLAVIGAHETRVPSSLNTKRLLATAEALGAEFYPVHPKFDEIFGKKCYHSIAEIPEDIDVMFLQVGDPVPVIREAAQKNTKFAIVFTAGYSEIGTEEAIEKEHALFTAVQESGVRLLGPNTNINSLELRRQLPAPKIGLITQSGSQGRPIIQGEELGVAFSFWAATGNEADLEASDFMEYFADDPDTTAIAAYIEGFKSGQRLREAALAALERDVSIVIVKVGRSSVGSSMAASHTAHLTGSDAAHDAFFEQYGITRVSDLDELLEVSNALARLRTPVTDGVVVYGMSGGSAAHLGDLVGAAGLKVPKLSQETQDQLKEIIPDYTVVHNPVDNGAMGLYAGTGPKEMDIVLADPVTGVLLYAIPGFFAATTLPMIESLEHAREVSDTPIMVIWSGPLTNDPLYQRLWATGIPVMSNMRNAVVATKALVTKHDRRESNAEFIAAARALPEITPYQGEVEQLDEVASVAWLSNQGINFIEHHSATDIESAVKASEEIGYPVVLKGRGKGLAHKSELGLIDVGLGSADEVRTSANGMVERDHDSGMEGFVVARQAGAGIELLFGITHDPLLGPVVVVGAGGVTAEAIKDISISVLPLLPDRARHMLESLRMSPLLDGWRGRPGVDKDALIALLVRLGEIAASGEVEELDINPVLASADGYIGLDALIRLRR